MIYERNGDHEMAPIDYKAPRHTNDSAIAQARRRIGWTQQQLADAIGTTQQQIQKWETGERSPKINALKRIGIALGVDWLDLIEEDK